MSSYVFTEDDFYVKKNVNARDRSKVSQTLPNRKCHRRIRKGRVSAFVRSFQADIMYEVGSLPPTGRFSEASLLHS